MLNALALSAEALASFLTQSPDCVKLLDTEGRIVWMNPNGLCSMEIASLDSLKGRAWSSLWPDDQRAMIVERTKAAARGEAQQFVAPCPTALGSPRWWDVTVSRVTDPDGDFAGFLSASRDITEAKLAAEAREIGEQEMRHRLRNSYAVVGSLVTGLARGNSTHEEFARQIAQRLHAMGSAQSLFSENDDDVDLGDLIRILAQPFDTSSCRLHVRVPEAVRVSRQAADAVALVVGELAVNSSKHGAIAHGGQIDVDVSIRPDDFTATWTERSRRMVARTSRAGGQGLDLIRRIVAARKGSLDTAWFESGLTTRITLPLSALPREIVTSASRDLSGEATGVAR